MKPLEMQAHLRMMATDMMNMSMSDTESYGRSYGILEQLGDESTKAKRVRMNLYLPAYAYLPESSLGWGRVHCEVFQMAHHLEFVEVSPKEGPRSGETFNASIYDLTYDFDGDRDVSNALAI